MKAHSSTARLAAALSATLCLAALPVQAHAPRARMLIGTVQRIQPQARSLTIVSAKAAAPLELIWKRDTRFIGNHRFVDSASLREGAQIAAYYHTPFFGKPYLSKVVWSRPVSADEKPGASRLTSEDRAHFQSVHDFYLVGGTELKHETHHSNLSLHVVRIPTCRNSFGARRVTVSAGIPHPQLPRDPFTRLPSCSGKSIETLIP